MATNPERGTPDAALPAENEKATREKAETAAEGSSKTEIEQAWDKRFAEAEADIAEAGTEHQAALDAYEKAEAFAKEHQDSEFLEKAAEKSYLKLGEAKRKLDALNDRLAKLKGGYWS